MPLLKDSVSDVDKEMIIAQALETEEGRVALAQAMVEPIRRSLEYQAVGRKLLMVDELPQGALARYERDVASIAHIVSRRGGVPQQIQEGEEFLVPTFEIAAYPTVRLSEIKARRFYIVDRAQIKAKEAIQKEEDTNIFNALLAAADSRADQIVTNVGDLTTTSLNTAFRLIEQHDLVASKIVTHANQYATIRVFGKDFYDEATQREVITTGLYGHLWTAEKLAIFGEFKEYPERTTLSEVENESFQNVQRLGDETKFEKSNMSVNSPTSAGTLRKAA